MDAFSPKVIEHASVTTVDRRSEQRLHIRRGQGPVFLVASYAHDP